MTGLLFLLSCKHDEPEVENRVTKNNQLGQAAAVNAQLGIAYLQQGNLPRAKSKLLVALKQAPNSVDVNAALGYYFEKTSELEAAKTYYLKALALAPNSGAQLSNYGAFLCKRGDYKQAETYFLKAVSDSNYVNTAGAYENAGMCAIQAQDLAKAAGYFEKALDQDPTRKTALLELLQLNIKKGDNKQSLALLEKYPESLLNEPALLKLAIQVAQSERRIDLEAGYLRQLQDSKQYAFNRRENDDNDNRG